MQKSDSLGPRGRRGAGFAQIRYLSLVSVVMFVVNISESSICSITFVLNTSGKSKSLSYRRYLRAVSVMVFFVVSGVILAVTARKLIVTAVLEF